MHPLPPKPAPAVNTRVSVWGPKRERTPSPGVDFSWRRKRNLRWPTVDYSHSIGLKGDGELAIRNISFSSDGGHFALSCESFVRLYVELYSEQKKKYKCLTDRYAYGTTVNVLKLPS